MTDQQNQSASDKGIGLAALFALLALGSGLVMFVQPGTHTAGWGFAAAMLFGALFVGVVMLYWE